MSVPTYNVEGVVGSHIATLAGTSGSAVAPVPPISFQVVPPSGVRYTCDVPNPHTVSATLLELVGSTAKLEKCRLGNAAPVIFTQLLPPSTDRNTLALAPP